MTKPIICIADCNHGFFEPELEESLKCGADLRILNCNQESLIKYAHLADILIVQRFQITAKVLDYLKHCKVIARYGVGLDNIDCEEVYARGIKLINFPYFCTEEVANHAMASILFCYRQFDIVLKKPETLLSRWGNPKLIKTIQSASDTTIGVLGAGKIGKAVISRLLSCGFKTIYHDPFLSNNEFDTLKNIGAEHVEDLERFLKRCSILTIHTPLTQKTNKMLNITTLNWLPEGSCLINTARGAIISTSDLELALSQNLRCAFIDVCDPEPPDIRILNTPGFQITPHCAFYSWQSLDRLKRGVIIDSVKAYEMQSSTSKCSE